MSERHMFMDGIDYNGALGISFSKNRRHFYDERSFSFSNRNGVRFTRKATAPSITRAQSFPYWSYSSVIKIIISSIM
ncbi:hypothetical protein [Neobacillus mesonae]|uniref:hypothetical protein n=1 Tax=Neobacillus mesonae TaxID=1193713 RepID=UPI000FD8B0F8|nr:hypothetical protein [Neobacillus mesonae]